MRQGTAGGAALRCRAFYTIPPSQPLTRSASSACF
uniref:Uncharacterized protein n=1 Tax=Rhizophora mucronata TaxID=61149 RepID=A0A2P2PZ58_RHIMU